MSSANPPHPVALHPIALDQWEALRETRLAALKDAPGAFGSTFERESAMTDDEWRARVGVWNSERARALLAWDGAQARGIVAGFLDQDDPKTAHLVSMWVDPGLRRSGVGARLVGAILDWARSVSAERVVLNVTSTNAGARAFYKHLGFTPTARTEPSPNDPAVIEHEMVIHLAPKAGT
ncbi:MAG TPA: GNAT family N-acetyltransferase, partial [Tepidisphaeraceae bacterium]|nr:GNAT family N-acetyltransferase [Tepidisphaeraceae bacterium]